MRLVVLDRDGTINHDSDAYVRSVAEFRPIDGSLEAIARLCRAGWTVTVATNQSGLARGYFDRATLDAMHAYLAERLAPLGGRIDHFAICPHLPTDGCDCRKPATGMMREILDRYGAPADGVPVIGDSGKDLEMARRMGARPMLVRTGKGRNTERSAPPGTEVYDDLATAVDALLA